MSTSRPKQFFEIVNHTLEEEGGYVNDSTDKGGETNFGISKRAYPDLDIFNLKEDVDPNLDPALIIIFTK